MFEIDDKVFDLTFHCHNYTRFGSYSFQEQSPEMLLMISLLHIRAPQAAERKPDLRTL